MRGDNVDRTADHRDSPCDRPWTQDEKDALALVADRLFSTLPDNPVGRLLQALALPGLTDLPSLTRLEFLREVYGDDYKRAEEMFDHMSHLRMAIHRIQTLKARVATLALSRRDLAAVLASLRIAQANHGRFVTMDHFNAEGISPHSIEELDELADKLNSRS